VAVDAEALQHHTTSLAKPTLRAWNALLTYLIASATSMAQWVDRRMDAPVELLDHFAPARLDVRGW